jgi:hypothetical protein
MTLDLFAGIPVTEYAAALPWYERFFGGQPSFLPNDIEAVWEMAVSSQGEIAGHSHGDDEGQVHEPAHSLGGRAVTNRTTITVAIPPSANCRPSPLPSGTGWLAMMTDR